MFGLHFHRLHFNDLASSALILISITLVIHVTNLFGRGVFVDPPDATFAPGLDIDVFDDPIRSVPTRWILGCELSTSSPQRDLRMVEECLSGLRVSAGDATSVPTSTP